MTELRKNYLIVAGVLVVLALLTVTKSRQAIAQGNPNAPSAPVNIVAPLPLPITNTGVVPAKPSDIVTLTSTTTFTSCTGTSNTPNIISIQIVDGSRQPFTIPTGQVLVVTGIDWGVFVTPALTVPGTTQFVVQIGPSPEFRPAVFMDFATIGAGPSSVASTGGKASVVPNLIVKPGAELCATFDGRPGGVVVHGFLTTDR